MYNPKRTEIQEYGRTVLEIVLVIMIMSVISVLTIRAYDDVMSTQKARALYDDIHMRVALNIEGKGTHHAIAMTTKSTYDLTLDILENEPVQGYFKIKASGVKRDVCKKLLSLFKNEDHSDRTAAQRLYINDIAVEGNATCPEGETSVAAAYKSARAPRMAQLPLTCTSNSECDISWYEVCSGHGECPTASVKCGVGDTCPSECQVCNTFTNICENKCIVRNYLQSNGNQWIGTEIVPSTDTKIETKFALTAGTFGKKSTKYEYLNGVTAGTCGRMAWGYSGAISTTHVYVGISNKNGWATGCPISKNQDYTLSFDGTGNVTCNETSETLQSENSATIEQIEQTNPMNIFARRSGTTNNNKPFTGKIYYLKISEGAILVRNLVPVYAPFQPAGKQNCMFDKVSKKLFCSAGSTDFEISPN